MGQPYTKSIQMLIAILIFLLFVYPAAGYDWTINSGDGSPENPYQISEPNQLPAINTMDTTGKYFVLMNDIDLDPNLPGNCIFDSAIIASDTFPPFSGVFDSNGHAIKNMRIEEAGNDTAFLGLFGEIGPEGIVRNLHIIDYVIRTSVDWHSYLRYVGSLAGHNLGVIVNCFSSGSAGPLVEGEYFESMIGGLVGLNGGMGSDWGYKDHDYRGLIANSGSRSTLTVLYRGGGLVSENYASIYQCYSLGTISQNDLISMDCNGGLVGANQGVVNQCFSDSVVDTDNNSGLVSWNAGIVRNCYALGIMTETCDSCYGSAGLVIENIDYEGNTLARIENCYAACQFEDQEHALGLAGGYYAFYGSVLSSFWDAEFSGTTQSCGGKGLTTSRMKDPNTFIQAGWDFVGETANGAEDIWRIDPNINNGYPWLVMRPIDGGDGSPENPHIIYTKQQLLDFFNDSAMWDKHIKLIANIDLSGMVFPDAPVGTFTGVLDGSGCSIYGFTSGGIAGLIDTIGRNGQVKNLFIRNASISGIHGGILAVLNLGQISHCHVEGTLEDGEALGGLVCANDGTIFQCSADCSVTGSFYGGGLAAYNSFFGTIRESCSGGSIGGTYQCAGGLAGQNYGKIEHCYTSASITGSDLTGSLAGDNACGVILCCYATGSPEILVGFDGGVVVHSYYGGVPNLQAWEGNSWYEEDGHIWTIEFEHDGRPLLKWQRGGIPVNSENIPGYWTPEYRQDPARDGSAEHPYRFSPEFRDFPADWDKHFVMTKDLDMGMTGYLFDEAVIPYFNGTVDGGGRVIKNLFLDNQDDCRSMGFFGVLGPDAVVKQLGIEGEITYYSLYPALFAGVSYGTLEECYAKGSVTCRTYGGILTGANFGTIRSCYAEGTLTLQSNHPYDELVGGGLYARSWGRVLNSYASVETIHGGELLYSGVGGLNESLVWNSFWNNDLTEPNFILGGKPLTDAQMKDPNRFIGWGDDIWKIAPGQDRPRLTWENTDWTPESGIPPEEWPQYVPIADVPRTYGGGNGTAQSPYVLTSDEHLFTLGKHISDCDKHFILDNDIDLSGQTLSESVIGYFSGQFNGRGHLINGLTINGYYHPEPYYGIYTSDVGLFGCIDTDGWVEKLGLINTDLYGMCQVGSVAGENNGTIRQCYADGYVTASGAVGGIAGMNGYYRPYHPNTRILESYSEVSVYGEGDELYTQRFLGGIAGGNMGLVQTCYSTNIYQTDPPPMGYEHVTGGIVGYNPGGMVIDCFYRQTSPMETLLGTELTNTQMKQKASFAGWDFADDGSDGPNNIWRMCADGADYPRLSWELGRYGDYACPNGVGMDDLETMAVNWLMDNRDPDFNYAADGSGDGVINYQELYLLSRFWGD